MLSGEHEIVLPSRKKALLLLYAWANVERDRSSVIKCSFVCKRIRTVYCNTYISLWKLFFAGRYRL